MIPAQIHSERATLALQKLVETDPAFGSLSLWCTHRDADPEHGQALLETETGDYALVDIQLEIAPAYTDGRTIFYGSAFAQWTLDEQVGVAAHEIMHVALQHITRAQKLRERYGPRYSNHIFNIAADALINETLIQSGYTLPIGRVELAKVLRIIGSTEQPLEALVKLDVEQLFLALLETAEEHGMQILHTFPEKADVLQGDVLGTEDALLSAEWAQRLDRALRAGQSAGRGVGQLMSKIGDLPKTTTPWEVILRRMVTKAVTFRPEYSFSTPTRRWLALDAQARHAGGKSPGFEPGIRQAALKRGRVAACVDVSGSISQPMLDRFGGEIDAISRKTGAQITLIVFDHGIQMVKELATDTLRTELLSLKFKGGGGTSFVEPVEEALKHDPSIIVVLTDLCGPFGPAPARIPVVWASTGAPQHAAPFGKTIYLKS